MWMVAAKGSKESYLSDLQGSLGEVVPFNVPDGDNSLKFGSFDDLIRLTDDIAKMDSQVEAIVRRIERSYYEVEPEKADNPAQDFKIVQGSKTQSFAQYMKNWEWNEAKYPKTRGLQTNLSSLMSTANKLDEEAKVKANGYNELKSAVANDQKKATGNLASRDLSSVLVPGVVQDGDFVQTEHLTTLVVILPEAGVKGFLEKYETYSEKVVPGSAKRFAGVSEEGSDTQAWRVVVFKSEVEAFLKKSREERVATVRQFEYSAAGYEKSKSQKAELQKACEQQEKMMKSFAKAAFSDAMVAWVHVKAMRVFVESVLRFGIPPNFGAFIVTPQDGKLEAARKVLATKLGGGADAGADDEEDYYPYVSVTFNPFSAKAQS
jgi:V-type H+-transporting ATPase subunit C